MTIDEMIEKLTRVRDHAGRDIEVAVCSGHDCCDPLGFSGETIYYPAHSLARLFKTDTPRPVVVLLTSGGLT